MMKAWKLSSISVSVALVLVAACSRPPEKPSPEATTTPAPAPPPATAPAPATNRYLGFVDKRDCDTVAGWVMDNANPTADIKVDLYIDNKLVESVPAKGLRQDLLGKAGTGRCGFTFKLPRDYKDDKVHTVNVKVAGSDYNVPFFQGVVAGFKCT